MPVVAQILLNPAVQNIFLQLISAFALQAQQHATAGDHPQTAATIGLLGGMLAPIAQAIAAVQLPAVVPNALPAAPALPTIAPVDAARAQRIADATAALDAAMRS